MRFSEFPIVLLFVAIRACQHLLVVVDLSFSSPILPKFLTIILVALRISSVINLFLIFATLEFCRNDYFWLVVASLS